MYPHVALLFGCTHQIQHLNFFVGSKGQEITNLNLGKRRAFDFVQEGKGSVLIHTMLLGKRQEGLSEKSQTHFFESAHINLLLGSCKQHQTRRVKAQHVRRFERPVLAQLCKRLSLNNDFEQMTFPRDHFRKRRNIVDLAKAQKKRKEKKEKKKKK
jgi:hypothetical protein